MFLVVASASLVAAWLAYVGVQDAARLKFQAIADDALNRIESRLELNLSLLTSTRAFFRMRGTDVSRVQFREFFDALNVDQNFKGLRGVGYMSMVPTGQEQEAERAIVKAQGFDRKIFPDTDQKWRTPIIVYEPLNDAALTGIGYDMFTDPVRRDAIQNALLAGEPRASGRVVFGQATGADVMYPGFLVFSTIEKPAGPEATTGIVYTVFRVADLFRTALDNAPTLPISLDIYDGVDDAGHLLFHYGDEAIQTVGRSLTVTRSIDVAGRTWLLQFHPTAAFSAPTSISTPILIGIGGLFLAAAIALVVRLQSRAVETEAALRETSEKALQERDLLLQEMKHRIKNSIARVLAIARQTVASSKSLDDFNASFSARLQAMAASQDMLTRSQWRKGDLGQLLRTELEQVFGQGIERARLSGPPVELSENATQALGLTFHELATNALKYGDAADEDSALAVDWSLVLTGGKQQLALRWMETSRKAIEPPSKTGFGTRLIEMNITRELGGTVTRDFGASGLTIDIRIPLQA